MNDILQACEIVSSQVNVFLHGTEYAAAARKLVEYVRDRVAYESAVPDEHAKDQPDTAPRGLGCTAVVMLPCPFCGGKPCVSESDDGMARWVCCETCECDGPPIDYRFDGTNEAARQIVVNAWNQRAT